jgi:hypothetical protein
MDLLLEEEHPVGVSGSGELLDVCGKENHGYPLLVLDRIWGIRVNHH